MRHTQTVVTCDGCGRNVGVVDGPQATLNLHINRRNGTGTSFAADLCSLSCPGVSVWVERPEHRKEMAS